MSYSIEEIDKLLHVIKSHQVENFKLGDLEVKISPVKYIADNSEALSSGIITEKITEDDLYYSSTSLKHKAL